MPRLRHGRSRRRSVWLELRSPCLPSFSRDLPLITPGTFHRLLRGGEQIHEVPINWRETGHSKVSLLRDPLRMFLGLVKFKRRLASGPPRPAEPV